MDFKQKNTELQILGEAILDYKSLAYLRPEDFELYSDYWKFLQEHNGNMAEILKINPNFYDFEKYVVYTCFVKKKMALWLIQNTFTRLLDRTYTWYSKNMKSPSEAVILNDLKSESKDEDIFDLIERLPDYFEKVGLDRKKIDGWASYCTPRIEEIKNYR